MDKRLIFLILVIPLSLLAPPPLGIVDVPTDCKVDILGFLSFSDAKKMSLMSEDWRDCFGVVFFSLCFLPTIKLPFSGVYDQLDGGRTLLIDDKSRNPITFLRKKIRLFWSKGILCNPPGVGTDLKLCRAGKPPIIFKLEYLTGLPKFLSPNDKYAAIISANKTDANENQSLVYNCENGDFVGLLPGYFGAFSQDDQAAVTWTEIIGPRFPGPYYRLHFYDLKSVGQLQKDCAGISRDEIDIGRHYHSAPASFGFSKNGRLAVLFEDGSLSVINTESREVQVVPAPTNRQFRINEQDCPFINQSRTNFGYAIDLIGRYCGNSAICFSPDDGKILIARPVCFNVIPEKYREFKKTPSDPDNETRFTLLYTIDATTGEPYGERHLIPGQVSSERFSKDGLLDLFKTDDNSLQRVYPMGLEDIPDLNIFKDPEPFKIQKRIVAITVFLAAIPTFLFLARKRIKMALAKRRKRLKSRAMAKKIAIEKQKMATKNNGDHFS